MRLSGLIWIWKEIPIAKNGKTHFEFIVVFSNATIHGRFVDLFENLKADVFQISNV